MQQAHRQAQPRTHPRHSIQQHNAEEQDRRAERAQDKVLETGFKRGGASPEIAHENIEPDRHRLERDKKQHEVIALREQHQRCRDDDYEVVKLGLRHRLTFKGDRRQKADQDRGQEEEHPHELAVFGMMQQIGERVFAKKRGVKVEAQAQKNNREAADGDSRDDRPIGLGQDEFKQEHQEREAGQEQFRHDRRPLVGSGELLKGR